MCIVEQTEPTFREEKLILRRSFSKLEGIQALRQRRDFGFSPSLLLRCTSAAGRGREACVAFFIRSAVKLHCPSLGARCWLGRHFEMSHGRNGNLPIVYVICFGVQGKKCIGQQALFYSLHKNVKPGKGSCIKIYTLFSCIRTVIFGWFLKDVGGGENVRKE